jgi:hypothetical protein
MCGIGTVIQLFGESHCLHHKHWNRPWWWRQRQSSKRWITTRFSHGKLPDKTSMHSVALKASDGMLSYESAVYRCALFLVWISIFAVSWLRKV